MNLKDIDRVFGILHVGYADRILPFSNEIERVGLSEKLSTVVTFKNPFDNVISKNVACTDKVTKNVGFLNLTMGHYSAMKTSLGLGYSNVMILEDDCRFLKDVEQIWKRLEEAPVGDVLLLDSFKFFDVEGASMKNGWVKCIFSRSSAAYIVNRRAMERITSRIEDCINGNPLRNIDGYFENRYIGNDMALYRAYPNVAMQRSSNTGLKLSVDLTDSLYDKLGIDTSLYAPYSR